jgi:ribosomal-protein-alanine N-acetyltransferase
MSALLETAQARFETMTQAHLEAVAGVESLAHAHPWLQRNFSDSLDAGYQAQMLLADDTLLGYFVAMKGFEEVHLLNITVAPAYQRQGWARIMLEAMALWSRGQGAKCLWLEARVGNTRALRVYEAFGFGCVGRRKLYYPGAHGQREDALVMRCKL